MTPQSGTWIGTLLNLSNGRTATVNANLQADNHGGLTGNFTAGLSATEIATGPFTSGSYTQAGEIHLQAQLQNGTPANFDGHFESNNTSGFAWGTITSRLGNANLVLLFVPVHGPVSDHVYGD